MIGSSFWQQMLRDACDASTHRRVWKLALPMVVSNVTVPMVSFVDITVAGHLTHAGELAAVAVGAGIFTVLVSVFGFLRMGTTGFAAQACGRGDDAEIARIVLRGLMLALAASLVAAIVLWFGLPLVLHVMNTPPRLHELASNYVHTRMIGLPAILANYALAGWLIGVQRTRTALVMLLVVNVSNVVLNLVLVLGWDLGVAGIAWASTLAAGLGTVFALACALRWLPMLPLRRHRGHPGNVRAWRGMLSVNGDIFVRSLILQGVFLAVTVLGTRLGADIVAANAVLLNGLMLVSFALDGLANAVEALSGEAFGRADGAALRRAVVVTTLWSLTGSVLFALAFLLFGGWFVDIQTDMETVRAAAHAALPWLVVLPLAAGPGFQLDGLFVGAVRAREMRNCMAVAAAGFALAVSAFHGFGNDGLWLAFLVFMAVRSGGMAWLAWWIHRGGGWIRQPDIVHNAGP